MKNQDDLILEENRRIRQLRIVTDLLIQTLMTRAMSLSDAELDDTRRTKPCIQAFPGQRARFRSDISTPFQESASGSGPFGAETVCGVRRR